MRSARGTAMIMMLVVAICLVDRVFSFALAQAPPVSINEVVDALRTGRSADALRLCGELLRADPQSYKVWTLRAMALEQSRQPKEALTAYQHALNLIPDYLPALEGAAQLNYKAQSPQAIPLLRKIILVQPANPTAHAMLGALEYRKRDYGQAAQDFAAAEQIQGCIRVLSARRSALVLSPGSKSGRFAKERGRSNCGDEGGDGTGFAFGAGIRFARVTLPANRPTRACDQCVPDCFG